jgi:hypothetical protein
MSEVDPNAGPVNQSPLSENQDKTTDVYFGVFFDVHELGAWFTKIGDYRKKGERWKEDFESDVQDNKMVKTAMFVEGCVKSVMGQLPNNPVSNIIQKGLDAKDKVVGIKDKVEGAVGKVTGTIDNVSNKIIDNDYVKLDGFDPLGSKRSIISLMEPTYVGGLYAKDEEGESNFWSDYNYRIYVEGSVTAFDFQPKKETEEKEPESEEERKDAEEKEKGKQKWREDEAKKAVTKALETIENKIPKEQKLSLHFDIFGYADDASLDNIEQEINNLKGTYPAINELKIDHIGRYNNFNDPDEVKSDLDSDTRIRFRNQGSKFLEQEK